MISNSESHAGLPKTHHLFEDNSKIFGVDSNLSFKKVVNHLKKNDLHDADAIFLTGDISQDESKGSYQLLVDELKDLGLSIYWIPGNHDSLINMESELSKNELFIRTSKLATSSWDYIFLNTHESGTDKGHLSEFELNLLETELKSSKDKSIAIVMHHHPVEVGTPLIDEYQLKNKDEFWNILSRYSVNLIICGHVHGCYTLNNGNTKIETSPATCLQWKKGTTDLIIEHQIGYKIYNFTSNHYVAETKIWNN